MDENNKNSFDLGDFFIGFFVGSFVFDAIRKNKKINLSIASDLSPSLSQKTLNENGVIKIFVLYGFLLQSFIVVLSVFILLNSEPFLTKVALSLIVDVLFFFSIFPTIIFAFLAKVIVSVVKKIFAAITSFGLWLVRRELDKAAKLVEMYLKKGERENAEKILREICRIRPEGKAFDYYRVFIEKLAEITLVHNAFFIEEMIKKELSTPLFLLYRKRMEKIMTGDINNNKTNNWC